MESEDRRPIFTKRLILTILVIILIILIILLLLRKCGSGKYSVTGITAQPTELRLEIGESERIYGQVEPSDASNTKHTCSSDNLGIAIVDNDCVVTAVGNGTTTIIVKSVDGGKTTSVPVIVGGNVDSLTGIQFEYEKYEVKVGGQILTGVVAVPNTAKLPELQYQISDPSVALVDAHGYVKGLKIGVANLTATSVDGKYTATTQIVVAKKASTSTTKTCKTTEKLVNGKCVANPTALILTEPNKTIAVGEVYIPGFKIEPSNATQSIVCTVPKAGQSILSESNCKLTGLKTGTVTVKVCAKENTKVCANLVITVVSGGGSGNGGSGNGGSGTSTGSCSLSYSRTSNTVSMSVNKPSGTTIKSQMINYNGSSYYASSYKPSVDGTASGQVWFSNGKSVTCPSISVTGVPSATTYRCSISKSGNTVSIGSVSASNGATGSTYIITGPDGNHTSRSHTATSAGTYSGKVTFSDGHIAACGSVTITANDIDRTAPTVSCSISNNNSANGVTVTITASDAGSGLSTNPSGTFGGIKANRTYTATDNAGNSKSVTVTVNKISNTSCPSGYSEDSSSGGNVCMKTVGTAVATCSSGTLVTIGSGTPVCTTTPNDAETYSYNYCLQNSNSGFACSCGGGTVAINRTCYNKVPATTSCTTGTLYQNYCIDRKSKVTTYTYSGRCN